MRLALALTAALGLAGLSLFALPAPEVQAQDTASFKDKFGITVTRADGKLLIAIDGKVVKDAAGKDQQWYVNRDYPIRLKVSNAKVAKPELVKEDATFEGTEEAGKAKKAKFATAVTDATLSKIDYKLVVCSKSSCSPPIIGTVAEVAPPPPPPPPKK